MQCFFQNQVIDSYIEADVFFPLRLELFQAIMHDYQECFSISDSTKKDQTFILYGQLISFFYRLLRRIVSKVHLPAEGDWAANQDFDFTGNSLLDLGQFMRNFQFRDAALRVVKATVDIERDRGTLKNKGGTLTLATVVGESLNPFLESGEKKFKNCMRWFSCA